jgi:hypothetical protein
MRRKILALCSIGSNTTNHCLHLLLHVNNTDCNQTYRGGSNIVISTLNRTDNSEKLIIQIPLISYYKKFRNRNRSLTRNLVFMLFDQAGFGDSSLR